MERLEIPLSLVIWISTWSGATTQSAQIETAIELTMSNPSLPCLIRLLKLFVRDGALYFLCIFSTNLMNVILYLVSHPFLTYQMLFFIEYFTINCTQAATEDLKAVGAR